MTAGVHDYMWGLEVAGQNSAAGTSSAGPPSPAMLEAAGGIGGLLAVSDPNDPNDPNEHFGDFVYFYDGNGNIGQVVDRNASNVTAAIKAKYEYDPYGNRINYDPNVPEYDQPWRFSTHQFDAETGLIYAKARYYSPGLGRWISRDPIAELGGENLYRYAQNCPTVVVDPAGLCSYSSDVSVGVSTTRPKAIDMSWTLTVGADCCCCGGQIEFAQIIMEDWTIGRVFPKPRRPGWEFDPWNGWYPHVTDLGNVYRDGRVVGRKWRMDDSPGMKDRRTSYLKQDFESCALCVSSDGYGNKRVCAIACIRWGHEWRRGWRSTTHCAYGNGSMAGAPSGAMTGKLNSLMAYMSGPLLWQYEGQCD